MNLKEIKEVIQIMNENQLSEFEMEKDGLKIRLKKNPSGSFEQVVYETRQQASPARAQGGGESREAPKPQAAAAKSTIKSPMVGTFYAAGAPDAPPLVQVGTEVQVGQVICIIEAMKLMNEIKAEVKGKIAELLVHNGDPVEFNQPLFVIE